jgi:hypothetical protein
MSEIKIAHLGFIQNVITRMAGNSFLLKGWTVTIVAALFALSAKDAQVKFIYIAYFPAIAFWILDAYYLHQERLFRELYKQVAIDNIAVAQFSMNTSIFIGNVDNLFCVFFSKTLLLFYLPLICCIVLAHKMLGVL